MLLLLLLDQNTSERGINRLSVSSIETTSTRKIITKTIFYIVKIVNVFVFIWKKINYLL